MNKGGAEEESWATRGERGAIVAIRLIVWIARHLGRPMTRLLLYPICLYFLVFSKASRLASRRYLRHVLEHEPALADCFRHYHSFAACVLDRVYLLNDELRLFDVRVQNEEIAKAELAHGKGCFLFGAHLGSFEILRALGHRQAGLKLSLLMYEENARKINSVLNAINPNLALEVIALGHANSMLAVERRLDQGHLIGILADRGLPLDDQEHIVVEFLGEKAPFPAGPFRLAAILRRSVVLMVGLYRGGRRYDVYFERLADFSQSRRETRPDEVEETVRRYAARLEHYCRLAPYNWFNFYDFWK
jgi:predicted LPLAT superfamily acyltransferase